MSGMLPPVDDDPRHLEIMQNWVRRIVEEVTERLAEGIVEDIGKIFLELKTTNYELHRRLEALEEGRDNAHVAQFGNAPMKGRPKP